MDELTIEENADTERAFLTDAEEEQEDKNDK